MSAGPVKRKKVDWRKVPVMMVLKAGDSVTLTGPAKIRGRILVGKTGRIDLVFRDPRIRHP